MTTDRRIIGFCKPSQPFRLQQGRTNHSSLNFSRGQVEHTTHTHSLSLSLVHSNTKILQILEHLRSRPTLLATKLATVKMISQQYAQLKTLCPSSDLIKLNNQREKIRSGSLPPHDEIVSVVAGENTQPPPSPPLSQAGRITLLLSELYHRQQATSKRGRYFWLCLVSLIN